MTTLMDEQTEVVKRSINLRTGCEFIYHAEEAIPANLQVEARCESARHRLLSESWDLDPPLESTPYNDGYGNRNRRLIMPAGTATIRYSATVAVPAAPDEVEPGARQSAVEELPFEVLPYLFPSRYCLSDLLSDTAWQMFGPAAPGWQRVQAVSDWIHTAIRYDNSESTTNTTALDVYQQRTGICRDFSHLGISFCRALNIPARYVFGYLPDIQATIPAKPMDFHAWYEVFLSGRWYTCDARHNTPRIGRVVVGYGRDAVDCSMLTTFGPATLKQMTVWADEA